MNVYCLICGKRTVADSAHEGGSEGYLCNEHNNEKDWESYCREETPQYDSDTGELISEGKING